MNLPFNESMVVRQAEQIMNYRKWVDYIPSFNLPRNWKIKVIPPFAGAVARFQLTSPKGKIYSVYLDAYNALGYYGKDVPYWEVYPVSLEDKVHREPIENLDKLIDVILKDNRKKKQSRKRLIIR